MAMMAIVPWYDRSGAKCYSYKFNEYAIVDFFPELRQLYQTGEPYGNALSYNMITNFNFKAAALHVFNNDVKDRLEPCFYRVVPMCPGLENLYESGKLIK